MKHAIKVIVIVGFFSIGTLAAAQQAHAAACANGVYHAGCVGPNGAAVARKPTPVYRHKAPVACANGVYRAGCVGPNGAAVVRKPY